jgi:hypothetical protein
MGIQYVREPDPDSDPKEPRDPGYLFATLVFICFILLMLFVLGHN